MNTVERARARDVLLGYGFENPNAQALFNRIASLI
jgi:hypothetical protein